jgi:hypothetical protein
MGKHPGTMLYINGWQPDIFTKPTRIKMRPAKQGVADCLMAALAIMASKTGHMMSCNNPVSLMKSNNTFAYLGNPPGYLMSKHKRRMLDSVPLHGITAAY